MSMLDELKKAGLTNDKKARQVERAKKQQHHHDLKTGEARKQAVAKAIQTDCAKDARPALAGDAEQLSRIYQDAGLSNLSGRKKFYFTTPDNYIDCLSISDVAAILLERGKLAIVENLSRDDYILVKRSTALAIEAIDKTRLMVFRRQEV